MFKEIILKLNFVLQYWKELFKFLIVLYLTQTLFLDNCTDAEFDQYSQSLQEGLPKKIISRFFLSNSSTKYEALLKSNRIKT